MAEVKLNGAKTLATMAEMFCNGDDRTEFILVADANENQAQVITHSSTNFMLNALTGVAQTVIMHMKREGANEQVATFMLAEVCAKAMAAVFHADDKDDEEEEE